MKIRFVIAAFLIILFVPFGFVKAQNISDDISYITNQNGVRISMSDYNLLTKICLSGIDTFLVLLAYIVIRMI